MIAGRDTSGVDKTIEEIKSKYESLGKKMVSDAESQAKQGKFEFVTKDFDTAQLEQIMQVATPNEQKELEKIIEKKSRKEKMKEIRDEREKWLQIF